MENDKSPGTNSLRKEFYDTFWNLMREIFVDFELEMKEKGHLSTSHRLAIIKKKD